MIRARESKSAPIRVVTRVLKILEALDRAPTGIDLKGVAQVTGINKSTAYRILAHLESEGYLFRGSRGAYFIGPKLSRLASANNQHSILREVSRPILQELWKATGETVNLAVPDGGEVLYLDVIESPHAFRLVSHAGMRRPIDRTSLGKAVLAHLPEGEREKLLAGLPRPHQARLRKELLKVLQRGYAADDEETTPGARCVGAAIVDVSGKVAGAISVSGPTARVGRSHARELGKEVAAAARAISSRLS